MRATHRTNQTPKVYGVLTFPLRLRQERVLHYSGSHLLPDAASTGGGRRRRAAVSRKRDVNGRLEVERFADGVPALELGLA
jgi:hypothetical protein